MLVYRRVAQAFLLGRKTQKFQQTNRGFWSPFGKNLSRIPEVSGLDPSKVTAWIGVFFIFLGHVGVSLNGGIPKTPQNDHF